MARVQVSDEVWIAFRANLGTTPVSEALGELVRREVGRAARRSANDADRVRLALEDARQLSDELAGLIARLERASHSAAGASGKLMAGIPAERPIWPEDFRGGRID
jgi:hypothetical protein